jgi:hypothetical protein
LNRSVLRSLAASAGLSLLVALIAGEAVVRRLGSFDEDGTFVLHGHRIRPYRPPIHSVERTLRAYLSEPRGYMAFDADLGWTNRPEAQSQDGLYRTNSAGLRANRDFAPEAPPGVLRIAIFGDSFVHGHDVPLAGSLAPQLEELLVRNGTPAETLNFGVGGYGIDQAYLRYRREGPRLHPAIVLLGLQVENIERSVNVVRAFYFHDTGIPFTKPRFVLDGKDLRAVNSPTVPLDQIPELLEHFSRSPLGRFEFFYRAADYEWLLYRRSRLLASVVDVVRDRFGGSSGGSRLLAPGSDATKVTLAIAERFRSEAEANGSRFLLVYLPIRPAIEALAAGRRDPYAPLVDLFRARFRLIDPSDLFSAEARLRPVESLVPSHYTPGGNRLVAEAIARQMPPAAR